MQLILVKCFQETTRISQYRTYIFNPHQYVRDIAHQQITIVGKSIISYFTYFRRSSRTSEFGFIAVYCLQSDQCVSSEQHKRITSSVQG